MNLTCVTAVFNAVKAGNRERMIRCVESREQEKKMSSIGSGRNSSVELFRCLLMFLIVLGHSWGQGVFSPGRGVYSEVDWWVFLMIGMLIWHVDGFIAISGWFGIRFSWKKFFYLLGTIFFYTVVFGAFDLCNGRVFSLGMLKLRSGWFGGSYLALMLTAPLLNSAVDALASRSKRVLLGAWLLLFLSAFFTWAPGHLFTGINALGFGHQTYAMMAFVYLTARTARYVFDKPLSIRLLGMLALLYAVYVVGIGIVLDGLGNTANPRFWSVWGLGLQNHSPIVYCPALVFLMVFAWHVKIPDWLGKAVLYVSPCMFGVYLFHCRLLIFSEKWLYGHVHWHPFWIMLSVSVFAFFVSVCVDMIRRALVSLWRVRLDCILNKVDGMWNHVILGANA